ncbi:hypothetical protein AVEN_234802-1 [Araneus ventricosus]|uniref:Uncharacterized protein n=1 Tax=Araneus ventricosus TaxID=182803 RepID=A0A4Y2F7J0_ARAVE|nr:hypothetical protein AVEN_234802-1 [Araneus ventricosus]
MMGLRRISVLLYVVGWIWNTPAAGWDVGVRFYGRHVRQILHRWIFPMGPSQGIGVARRSDNTNGLRCSSACCLYLGGPRDAAACDESHSTACSSLPRHARRTLWTSALNCAHTAVDMFNKVFFLAPAVTSYFVFRIFLVNYGSYRNASLGSFYVLPTRNLAWQSLCRRFGTPCIYMCVLSGFLWQICYFRKCERILL